MTFLFACQRSIDIIINIIAIVLVVVHELNIFIMTDIIVRLVRTLIVSRHTLY